MFDSAPTIDFLVQLTGDRHNPTGIITPLTEKAFEFVHDHGLEYVAYDVTASNGYKLSRRDVDDFVEYAEIVCSIAMYHPEYGVAMLETV